MTETWVPVVGLDGWYEVSDLGQVRSWRRCGPNSERAATPKALRHWVTSHGYPMVSLCFGTGKPIKRAVHVLVLEAFRGPRPGAGFEACHNDGAPGNCRLDNLRWDTASANNLDKYAHGTAIAGERHPCARLTDAQVRQIRALCGTRLGHVRIAAMFGVSRATISDIANRRTRARLDDGMPARSRRAGGLR